MIDQASSFVLMMQQESLMIGVLGFDSQQGLGIFLFTTTSRIALGPTQPPIQWVPVAFFPGGKVAKACS
jgi:hypothetical protein